MGLFDGRIDRRSSGWPGRAGPPRTWPALLGAPVVLVVDARGQSHSIAALLHGFATFDAQVRIAGVILNRVGSPRHEEVLRQACEQRRRAGARRRSRAPTNSPSRHGIWASSPPSSTAARPRAAVAAMTALVARHVDLAAVVALAAEPASTDAGRGDPAVARPVTGDRVTVALAAGKAFTFGYAEHGELLRAAGADVVEFDPLTDPLPPGTAALVLPGGFPEQFTAELSANDVVRQQISALADSGAPIHAECAGPDLPASTTSTATRCAGCCRGSARFTEHLTLGYRDAVAVDRLVAARRRRTGRRPRIPPHRSHIRRQLSTGLGVPGPRAATRPRRRRARRRARRLSAHPPRRAPARDSPLRRRRRNL